MTATTGKIVETIEALLSCVDGKCSFVLNNGRYLEGFIVEVGSGCICFGCSGPLAEEELFHIRVQEIDLATFSYLIEQERRWAGWNELLSTHGRNCIGD